MREPRSIAVTLALAATAVLFAVLSLTGIGWGLPSRRVDRSLFGVDDAWSGARIHRLADVSRKFSPVRGADVDADPLRGPTVESAPLTATVEDVAKIYLRFRLYTHQPDEMITMMALAGMQPGRLQLDPKLYQYGGLFLYPVGALIKLCGMAGWIDVRNDVAFYLDHPEQFGKFYVVARAYSAAWGVPGILLVFAIARRIGGDRAGLLAALLFVLLPVVACMSHEGKPHLPGAVLMLAAVYFGMRCVRHCEENTRLEPVVDNGGGCCGVRSAHASGRGFRSYSWPAMCVCCGAAVGMVLSSWPIMVLIPLVTWFRCARENDTCSTDGLGGDARSAVAESKPSRDLPSESRARRAAFGTMVRGLALAGAVYCLTNPYVVINLLVNREVLRSNFGNSLAMYQVARAGEGLRRVVQLTVEGATLPVTLLGTIALGAAVWRRRRSTLVLVIPAAVFFLQFVMIGAGKPAEYGRFGIFHETGLAIGAACCLLSRNGGTGGVVGRMRPTRAVVVALVLAWAAWFHGAYIWNFVVDTRGGSRWQATQEAAWAAPADDDRGPRQGEGAPDRPCRIALTAEPAPYSCPPVAFDRCEVTLHRDWDAAVASTADSAGAGRAYRTVDGRLRIWPTVPRWRDDLRPSDSWWMRLGAALWTDVDTPISWANKPIEVGSAGRREVVRGR